MPNTKPKHRAGTQPQIPNHTTSAGKKLGQVDFLGSFLLAAFLILTLLPIEFGGNKIAWTDPQIPIYFGLAAVALGLFIMAEKRRKPSNQLLPLSMFRSRHTVSSFLIILLQLAAQLGVRAPSTGGPSRTPLTFSPPPPLFFSSSSLGPQIIANHPMIDDVYRSVVLPSHAEIKQHFCWGEATPRGHRECLWRHRGWKYHTHVSI